MTFIPQVRLLRRRKSASVIRRPQTGRRTRAETDRERRRIRRVQPGERQLGPVPGFGRLRLQDQRRAARRGADRQRLSRGQTGGHHCGLGLCVVGLRRNLGRVEQSGGRRFLLPEVGRGHGTGGGLRGVDDQVFGQRLHDGRPRM